MIYNSEYNYHADAEKAAGKYGMVELGQVCKKLCRLIIEMKKPSFILMKDGFSLIYRL
jgi:hypothetical protein